MGSSFPRREITSSFDESPILISKRFAHERYSVRLREKSIELEGRMLQLRTEIFKKYPYLEQYYHKARECSKELISQCGFYRGQVKNHLWHGVGEELHFEENGESIISYYIGQFMNELKSGQGCMIYPSGEYYVGTFEKGFANGKGTYVLADQSYYEGNWVNNLQEGHGVIKYYNNSQYEGEFKAGYMWGKGRYIWENGNIYEGTFEKDQIVSGRAIYQDSSIEYVGEFQDGVPHGNGRCYNKSTQTYYAGQYLYGERHGYGQTNENGQIQKGQWQNNYFREIKQQ